MATAQVPYWLRGPKGHSLCTVQQKEGVCIAMADPKQKLVSVLGYAQRHAKKMGLTGVRQCINSALTTVLTMDSSTTPQINCSMVVDLNHALPDMRMGCSGIPSDQGACRAAACQTDFEMITRAQCESLVMDIRAQYAVVLEQAKTQIKNHVATIQQLDSELEAARNEVRTRLEAIESKVLPVPATSPTFPRALAHGDCESKRCRVGDSRYCSLGPCSANSSASASRASSFAERVAAKTERRKARFLSAQDGFS